MAWSVLARWLAAQSYATWSVHVTLIEPSALSFECVSTAQKVVGGGGISSSVAARDEPFRPTNEPFRPTAEPTRGSATAPDSPEETPGDSPETRVGEASPTVTEPPSPAPPTMNLLCDANDSPAMIPDNA